jgi:PTH1 family peptidyl-tRNA hydrolase
MARRPRDSRRGTPADLMVVGFGNPGDEYAATRHNVGTKVAEELVRRHGGRLRRAKREQALTDELNVAGRRLAVVVPVTFYNEAGRAVAPLARRFGIDDLSRLVVVHDELDLPVGRIKVKLGGGLAGNNGLKSLRDHLHSADFVRVRVGIGKPPPDTMKGRDYVLRRPSRAERPEVERTIGEAADAVEHLLDHDLAATMNRFNAG